VAGMKKPNDHAERTKIEQYFFIFFVQHILFYLL